MCAQMIHNQDYIVDLFHRIGNTGLVKVCLKSKAGKEFNTTMSVLCKKDGSIELNLLQKEFMRYGDEYTCHVLRGRDLQALFSFDVDVLLEENDNCIVKMPDNVTVYLEKYYPLTYSQKSIWNSEEVYPGTSLANFAVTVRIKDSVDFEILEQSINMLIKLNDGIRIRICEKESNVVQYVSEYAYINVDFIDFSNGKLEELYNWDKQQNQKIFELKDTDLFYFCMLKLSDVESGFYIKIHHVICDAWGMFSVIISKILKYYSILKNKNPIPEISSPSYFEYVIQENTYLHSNNFKESKRFWNEKFSTIPDLMLIKPYLAIKNYKDLASDRKTFVIHSDMYAKIKEFCKKERIPAFSFFLSIISIYIFKITSKQDIVIGIPVRNRSKNEKDIIGMFVNTIPMRIKIEPNLSFVECAKQITDQATEFLEHKKYPYELIQQEFRKTHNVIHNMFDVSFSYQSAPVFDEHAFSNVSVRWHSLGQHQVQPLIIHVSNRDDSDSYIINLDYLISAFSANEIEQIQQRLLVLIEEALSTSRAIVCKMNILPETERLTLLHNFNNTFSPYPKHETVHHIFETQVNVYSNEIALIFEDKTMTYRELNNRSNQVACMLIKKGVKNGNVVGLMLDRSLEMIIGIFGILKAGAAYLPIDLEFPQERVNTMLKDSNSKIVITHKEFSSELDKSVELLSITDISLCESEKLNLSDPILPNDIAYIMYTSGSTGIPKGIEVSHRNIIRTVKNTNYINIRKEDRILQLSNYAFDGSVFDIFGALLNGATLVLINQEDLRDITRLSQIIEKQNITISFITTALFNALIDVKKECFKHIRKVLFGGERASYKHVEKLFEYIGKNKIINVYGPTETTVFATYYCVNDLKSIIPIGTPISNSQVYILDTKMNLQPIGVIGEMYVAGDGVSKGYLNNAILTAEKFINNPFAPDKKMYKTGDLARWLQDGNIEFVGRVDNQIKMRGFRIELDEIESQLSNHPDICKVVVLFEENKYLSAYIVCKENAIIKPDDLKTYLSNELPYYMIPSRFIIVDQIPLTSNGKVDKKYLQDKYKSKFNSSQNHILPVNKTQKVLAKIWEEELNVVTVGITDNYFELGGDSLKAIGITYKIQKRLGDKITFKDILSNPTVQQLYDCLFTKKQQGEEVIALTKVKDFYSTSYAQRGIYLINQTEPSSTNYNMPMTFVIDGDINIKRLENALRHIIHRHEVLRTSFVINSSGVVQQIFNEVDFKICYMDSYLEEEMNNFIKPFDLQKPPFIRVTIMKLSTDKHIMLFDMHHIISDEVSINILFRELKYEYEGNKLSALSLQYKDFAEWQNEQNNTLRLEKQKEFWGTIFKELPQALDMTIDYIRPSKRSFEGARLRVEIDEHTTEEIDKFCKESNSTLFTFLLTVYKVLLYRYTQQEDIVVGIPANGRSSSQLENLIGMFVNTLPIRTYPKGEKTFRHFFKEVKESCMGAFENKDYPLEHIVRDLDIQTDPSRNPLFDVMFSLNNTAFDDINIGKLKFSRKDMKYDISKFDITLIAVKKNEKIFLEFEYCTSIFKQQTIESFKDCFIVLLKDCVNSSDKKLMQLELLSDRERDKILYEFNDTYCEYPKDKTLHQLFEEQVERVPGNIALVFQDKQVTYRELNSRANQLAHVLRGKGVKPNDIVGILVERSVEMIVGMLGILKSGGAYLPIEVNLPYERVRYLIEDSKMKVLITREHLLGKNDQCFSNLVETYVVLQHSIQDKHYTNNLSLINTPSDLAYVIYTSGTTGNPKGVMLEHKGVVNFIFGMSYKIEFSKDISILAATNISFDIFVLETLLPLVKGIKIVLVDEEQQGSAKCLNDFIRDKEITMLQLTPTRTEILLSHPSSADALKSVKTIILGGEPLSPILYRRLMKICSAKLFNAYGPTETTVWSTVKDLSDFNMEFMTIGKPIANTRIYIVDKELNILPIGAKGELCIAGDGLARGYLNRMTDKFINAPFLINQRLYRTGDLAKWLPQGEIELLGRIDNQIKIRGIRIELEEIEHNIKTYPGITHAVIIVAGDSEIDKHLVAFFVCKYEIKRSELIKYLLINLPYNMIPSQFVQIDEIPLTKSGKIDRKAVRSSYVKNNSIDLDLGLSKEGIEIEQKKSHQQFFSEKFKSSPNLPRNRTDEILLSMYQEIFQTSIPGIDVNFFKLGGNSIKAMNFVSRMLRHKWSVTIQDVYKFQTIRELSNKINKTLRK